jgi:hypothetical protein
MKITIQLIENTNEFIASCPELDINCYASNRHEAIHRIKKVISFYVDSARELGLDVQSFDEISIEGECQISHNQEITPSSASIH